VWFARRIHSVAWALVFGLLLGGVLGNLTDRLLREPSFGLGHVIDFISTPWMLPAIYNVADISIVSSMVLFMILTIRGVGLDGTRESSDRMPRAMRRRRSTPRRAPVPTRRHPVRRRPTASTALRPRATAGTPLAGTQLAAES
jgi:signal peptidase II